MKALLVICCVALLATGVMIFTEWGKPARYLPYQPSAFDVGSGR